MSYNSEFDKDTSSKIAIEAKLKPENIPDF